MIGKASTAASFGALARYLEAGRRGTEFERVAWRGARNLPTDDPRLAAAFMQAEAGVNGRVTRPVYHLVLSFDVGDRPSPATMARVADRVLGELGLAEHQALLVAHRDRAHPHLHLMVNRVHPGTGKAWDTGHDYARIERVLRAVEQEFGLRAVPGRHSPARTPAPAREMAAHAPVGRADVAIETRHETRVDGGVGERPVALAHAVEWTAVGRETPGGAVDRRPATRDARDGWDDVRRRDPGTPPRTTAGVRGDAEHTLAGLATASAHAPASARTKPVSVLERAHAALPALRAANDWATLDRVLAAHGLRYAARGAGGVILAAAGGTRPGELAATTRASRVPGADVEQQGRDAEGRDAGGHLLGGAVRASQVAPELSRPRLEARFGVRFAERLVAPAERPVPPAERLPVPPAREAAVRPTAPPIVPPTGQPTLRWLAVRLPAYEQALRLDRALAAAAALRQRAEGRLLAIDAARNGARDAERVFVRSMAAVYRDPAAAARAITGAITGALRDGTPPPGAPRAPGGAPPRPAPGRDVATVAAVLRTRPEQFGALLQAERSGRFGIARVTDVQVARTAATVAATRLATWQAAVRAAPSEHVRDVAARAVAHHRDRQTRLYEARQAHLANGRQGADLAPAIARAVGRLRPEERTALGRLVSTRQAALGEALAAAVPARTRGAPSPVSAPERGRAGASPALPDGDRRDRNGAPSGGPRAAHERAALSGRLAHEAIERLAPTEFRQLRAAVQALTAPHLAVAQTIRRAVRDAVLGRDGNER